MLITSRDSRRWVIPKGNRMRGVHPQRAAEIEAYEEAGISGVLDPTPIGTFGYAKRRADGSVRSTRVDVFPLAVTAQSAHWPEQDQRDTRWFSLDEAAAAVDEPELRAIIRGFRQPAAA